MSPLLISLSSLPPCILSYVSFLPINSYVSLSIFMSACQSLFLHLPYIFVAYQSLFSFFLSVSSLMYLPSLSVLMYLTFYLSVFSYLLVSYLILLILSLPLYLPVSRSMYVPKLSSTMYLSLSLPISLASTPVSYVYLSCLRFSLSSLPLTPLPLTPSSPAVTFGVMGRKDGKNREIKSCRGGGVWLTLSGPL